MSERKRCFSIDVFPNSYVRPKLTFSLRSIQHKYCWSKRSAAPGSNGTLQHFPFWGLEMSKWEEMTNTMFASGYLFYHTATRVSIKFTFSSYTRSIANFTLGSKTLTHDHLLKRNNSNERNTWLYLSLYRAGPPLLHYHIAMPRSFLCMGWGISWSISHCIIIYHYIISNIN